MHTDVSADCNLRMHIKNKTMLKFLFKGILRDKSRSVLPIIVTAIGVWITVMAIGYVEGAMDDIVDQNAKLETGHVKVMTRAYAENKDQLPNDLAILGVNDLMTQLKADHPDMDWVQRIKFGGLLDVPDEGGLTKAQGPALAMALEIINSESTDAKRLNLEGALVSGSLPAAAGEILMGDEFASRLKVGIGDQVTFIGSTMYGSMSLQNYTIKGTINFGTTGMDRSFVVMDLADAQLILDMEDGSGEILGYFPNDNYDRFRADEVEEAFNATYSDAADEFSPQMFSLRAQNNLAEFLDFADYQTVFIVTLFVIAMSIVLWNTGLLGGLRRYQEFGIRLALGEAKGAIYRSLIFEACFVGLIGSAIGTVLGLAVTYYLQEVGIDIKDVVGGNSTMLMPSIIKAKITPQLFYIGFIPGLFAVVLGNMLSGMGIYKRETASLFKELEV